MVEVLLPQAFVFQELLVVDPLDVPLRKVTEPVDARLAREFNGPGWILSMVIGCAQREKMSNTEPLFRFPRFLPSCNT